MNAIQNQKHETWTQAKKAKDQADVKTFQATIESEMANEKAKKSNVFNRKQRETDAKTASDQQKQYAAKSREAGANEQKARRELDKAIDAYNKNAGEEYDNQRIYENSLAGRVDRTTAAASSAFNKAKNTANNAVSNAKNAYERMRGEFRDKVNEVKNDIRESTGQAARDRMDAAAEKYPELENDRRKKKQEYEAAKYQADRASNKLADAYADARVAEGRADRSNIFNRKQRNNEAENARKVEAEARRAFDEAVEREGDAMTRSINANQKYANSDLDYQAAKKVYENSLAGAVDRTAARASFCRKIFRFIFYCGTSLIDHVLSRRFCISSSFSMPVDPGAAAEAVECILGKGFPIAADSHGHVGADRREHATYQICKEFHHRKSLCLLRTAGTQMSPPSYSVYKLPSDSVAKPGQNDGADDFYYRRVGLF